jgi:heme O synthase-like polyprenyltransferase
MGVFDMSFREVTTVGSGTTGVGKVISLVVAILFAALAIWVSTTGQPILAVALAVVSLIWVVISIRSFRRERGRIGKG